MQKVIVWNLAADLQDPVDIINEMLKYYVEENYKVVLPVRGSRDDSFLRNFASNIFIGSFVIEF